MSYKSVAAIKSALSGFTFFRSEASGTGVNGTLAFGSSAFSDDFFDCYTCFLALSSMSSFTSNTSFSVSVSSTVSSVDFCRYFGVFGGAVTTSRAVIAVGRVDSVTGEIDCEVV